MAAPLLTPPTISTLPNGLLRYLGIQSGGRYPQNLDETIGPGLELIDLLTISTDVAVSDIIGATSTGTKLAPTLIVSTSKVVRCSLVSARALTTAGEAIKFGIILVHQNGAASNLSGTVTLAASTGDQIAAAWTPVWLQPGDQLAIQVYSITTAGTININLTIRKSDFYMGGTPGT
jgi:hypothetical protein